MNYLPDDLLFTIFIYLDTSDLIKIPEFKSRINNNWPLLFTLYFTYVDINQIEMIDYSSKDFDYLFVIYNKLKIEYDLIMDEFIHLSKLKQKLLENIGYTDENKEDIISDELANEATSWMLNIRAFNNIKLFLDILKPHKHFYDLFLNMGLVSPHLINDDRDIIMTTIIGDRFIVRFSFYDPHNNIRIESDLIRVPLKRGLEILMYGLNINAVIHQA